jgi:hypothetical protein
MANPDSNARFLSYDSSKIDLGEKKSTKNNDKTAYHTAAEIASAAGVASSGFTYTEVAVPSGVIATSGILGMGSVPVEILPAPGANKYYEYFGYAEYTYNTTQYNIAAGDNPCIVGENSYGGTIVERPFFTGTSNHVFRFSINSMQTTDTSNEDYQMVYKQDLNERVILTTFLGNDPTAGDGTILVKIWYKIKTFGTEL